MATSVGAPLIKSSGAPFALLIISRFDGGALVHSLCEQSNGPVRISPSSDPAANHCGAWENVTTQASVARARLTSLIFPAHCRQSPNANKLPSQIFSDNLILLSKQRSLRSKQDP